jgi:predicted ArsR family transcriptional regulator
MSGLSRTALEDGDLPVLKELHARQSVSVQDLCDILGVTATAVRQRLMRLHSLGLISKVIVPSVGRGRPQHAYSLTDAGQRELGDNYGELAVILWNVLRTVTDQPLREQIFRQMREQMARSYGKDVTGDTVVRRLEQLRKSLAERGFSVDVSQQDGLPVLQEHHCPYHDLAAEDATICQLEQQVFEQILGVPLELVQACRDGHSCCEFRVQLAPSEPLPVSVGSPQPVAGSSATMGGGAGSNGADSTMPAAAWTQSH